MLPKSHPLIEAATKPLAHNAEQRLAAIAMLGENFDPENPAIETSLARLTENEENRRPPVWKIILWIAAAISLALALYSQIPVYRFLESLSRMSIFSPLESPPLPLGLTEKQRLLLGDPNLLPIERSLKLHLSDPGNPAYYIEYAHAYASENERLPADFTETVARIAPDNAFFLYFAAGYIGKESFEKKRRGSSGSSRYIDGVRLSPLPIETEYTITNVESFDEAMALMEKASALPDFQTYTSEMMAARSGALETRSMVGFLHTYAYVWGSPAAGIISLRQVVDLMSARAEMLSKAGKKEEFLALAKQREAFVSGLANNHDTILVGELVYKVIAIGTAVNFHAAAERLSLDTMAETYLAQRDGLQAMGDQRNIRARKEADWVPEERAGLLAGLSLPLVGRQALSPPPIRESELKPLRLAEHDFAFGLGITAIALILLIACVPVLLFRFLSPPPVRLPAKRLATLLRTADWVWVFLCGIVLPLVIHLVINRLTPLGGRDFGLKHFLFIFPGVQLLAILMSLLLAPAALIRWRLSKRLAPFGMTRSGGKISGIVLFIILFWSLTAYPVLVHLGLSRPLLIGIAAVPMLWLANVFLNILQTFLGKPPQRIIRTTTSVALPAAYAAGIVALCLTLPIFTASEKHWVKQDALFRIDPDAVNLGAYEFKASAQVRKEINTILGLKN